MPFIVDTDMALFNDDAQALLLLADSAMYPAAITTVAGNLTPDLSARLALHLYSLLNCRSPLVVSGAQRPMVHRRRFHYNHSHGYWDTNFGVKSPLPLPPLPAISGSDEAHMLIARLVRENTGIDLLCLGPLTNIALALKVEPDLPSMIGRVVIMGGVLLERFPFRGNITPLAEFNFWVDPDAAHKVLNSGLRCEVVPLNVCAGFFFNRDIADGWLERKDPLGEAFHTVFEEAFHRMPNLSVPMYDQIAAIAFLEPRLFTWEYCNNIAVVRKLGIHQGMCLIKPSLPITQCGSFPDTKYNSSNFLTSRRVAIATRVDRSSLYNFLIKLTKKRNQK